MITKHEREMFHHECWKPIFWGSKGQDHEAKNIADVVYGAVVSAGFL